MNKILFRNYRIALTMALLSFALWAHGQATDSVTVKGTIPTHLIKVQEADGTQAHMGQMMGIVDYGDGDSLVSFLPVYFINDSLLVIGTDTLATRAYSRQNATESDPTVPAYAKTLTGASVVLSGLITVDGTGSGLDADLLDGQHGTYYLGIDSLDGVSNDGGNIDLVAGSNIIITPDDGANTITIAATASLNGSGTINYIPKFTPDGNTLGNSQIFSNGTNVGIGTTSPATPLHLTKTNTRDLFRVTSTENFNAAIQLITDDGDDLDDFWRLEAVHSSVNGFAIENDGVRHFYIEDTGDVGIGTTSPGSQLHISKAAGAGVIEQFRLQNSTGGTNTGPAMSFYAGGGEQGRIAGVYYAGRNAILTYTGNTPVLRTVINDVGLGIGGVNPTNMLHVDGSIRFEDFGNGVNTSGNPVNVLSTDPTGILQSHPVSEVISAAGGVTGTGTANYVTKWTGTSTLGSSSIFDNGAIVGVGTATGTGKLNVRGEFFIDYTTFPTNGASIRLASNASDALYYTNNYFGASATRFARTGQYSHQFSMKLSDGSYRFRVSNGTGNTGDPITYNDLLIIEADGDVGIGTTFPGEKLHVSGNVRFSGALMPNNAAGTSGQVLTSAGAGSPPTWTTPATGNVSGTGSANTIAYWTGASTLTNNSNLAYNGTNLTLGTGTLRIPDGSTSLPSLTFGLDTDNGLYRLGANNWGLSVNQTSAFEMAATGATVNNSAANFDLRIKGDTDADLFWTDASTDRVGIGTATPTAKLNVSGSAHITGSVGIGTTDSDAELVIENSSIANVAIRSTTDNLNTFWSLENEAQDNNSYAVYRDGLTENMIIARSVDQPFATLSTTYVEFENGGDVRIHQKIQLGSSGNLFIFWGTGTPEGVVTAAIGSTYHRTDGGSGTSYYVKESGTGNTGWVAK